MALTPIRFNSPLPPGRPRQAAEPLPVPGAPQAAQHRPAQSPGRLPVASTPGTANETEDLAGKVDREVRTSREYQILKPYLRDRHEDEDERADRAEDRQDDEHAASAEPPPQPAAPPPPANSAPAEVLPSRDTVRQGDPLALDLDGDGLRTTGIEQGVRFDLNADGRIDRTSFASGSDAFLALDRTLNGRIDDGRELFGDQDGHANGFEALAVHDDNGDGRIDSDDAVYDRLRLLRVNADGSQQLTTLRDAGVAAINLDYQQARTAINRYDSIAQTGSFTRTDGSSGEAGDLLLGYRDEA